MKKLKVESKKASVGFPIVISLCLCVSAVNSPAQSGPPYEITQSVIAGGGSSSTGAPYSATGTIAQPVAGTNSTGGAYGVRGGFWHGDPVITAALVSISGSVVSGEGTPIRNVRVTLADSSGVVRSAVTNAFGLFRFDDVEVGHTYVVSASHKRYTFAPRVIVVDDEVADLLLMPID